MSKAPPVPPAGRTRKGGDSASPVPDKSDIKATQRPENHNDAEQGAQGNIRQNTRNQGYQQDR